MVRSFFDSSDLDVEQHMPLICLPDLICNCLLTHMHRNMSPAQSHLSVSNTGRRQNGVMEGDNEAAIFLTAPDNSGIKSNFALTAKCGETRFSALIIRAEDKVDRRNVWFYDIIIPLFSRCHLRSMRKQPSTILKVMIVFICVPTESWNHQGQERLCSTLSV